MKSVRGIPLADVGPGGYVVFRKSMKGVKGIPLADVRAGGCIAVRISAGMRYSNIPLSQDVLSLKEVPNLG